MRGRFSVTSASTVLPLETIRRAASSRSGLGSLRCTACGRQLLDGLRPGRRVVAQVQVAARLLEQGSRDLRLPIAARRTFGDRVERGAADGIDVADDALGERLDVEDHLIGDELFGPIAAGAAQAGPDVGSRLVERETGEALMRGAGQRPTLVLREQVGDELLAARQPEQLHDRPVAQPHLRQRLELA